METRAGRWHCIDSAQRREPPRSAGKHRGAAGANICLGHAARRAATLTHGQQGAITPSKNSVLGKTAKKETPESHPWVRWGTLSPRGFDPGWLHIFNSCPSSISIPNGSDFFGHHVLTRPPCEDCLSQPYGWWFHDVSIISPFAFFFFVLNQLLIRTTTGTLHYAQNAALAPLPASQAQTDIFQTEGLPFSSLSPPGAHQSALRSWNKTHERITVPTGWPSLRYSFSVDRNHFCSLPCLYMPTLRKPRISFPHFFL